MFILASSVCKSLRCLVSALTPGCEGGHLFRLTCSVVLWGGRNTANITGMCAECSQCLGHTRFAPTHSMYAFPVYTAQAPGCSAEELSKVGPGLNALPRSKPLRFRFSGMPQRHRLGWVCIVYPSQVRAAQVTRCWQAHSPRWTVCLITSPVPGPRFPGCSARAPRASSQVCHVSSPGS